MITARFLLTSLLSCKTVLRIVYITTRNTHLSNKCLKGQLSPSLSFTMSLRRSILSVGPERARNHSNKLKGWGAKRTPSLRSPAFQLEWNVKSTFKIQLSITSKDSKESSLNYEQPLFITTTIKEETRIWFRPTHIETKFNNNDRAHFWLATYTAPTWTIRST